MEPARVPTVLLVAVAVVPIILEMIAVVSVDCLALKPFGIGAASTVRSGAVQEYDKFKDGLDERKREMCSFLLTDLNNRPDEKLELNKVTRLFEASLDHLAKTTSYVTLLKPYVDEEVISSFDDNAGVYVLNISDTRRKLIEEYEQASASGASEEAKRNLLENYFYQACEIKLSTIVTEKSMYDSALKAEKQLQVNLINKNGKQ